ncbi:hypothetical protein [Streptomyces luteireticuli]|uniref:hypothetical protein n=1 Tax=Streptomyces luteireticuli TaxID=173858 RepID=UPI003558A673
MSTQTNSSAVRPISLMAAGELRDAMTAIEEGKGPAAVAALMSIDSASWQAIEQRLAALVGTDLRELLLKVAGDSGKSASAIA